MSIRYLISWVKKYDYKSYNRGFLELFIVLKNFAPNVVMAVLQFHTWTYKLALKFRAKIKRWFVTHDVMT